MAGHSKWANIKHRKGRQDARKGKIFTRIANEITIASRDNGPDPDANPRLRLALKMARLNSLPKDNITRAIKKGTGENGAAAFEEITFEGYAPNGIAIIIETFSDNRRRTVPNIRATFSKYGGNLGENGSVMWNFTRKGVITIANDNKSEEELLELVIKCGGEDLNYNEESSNIICEMTAFGEVTKYLDDNNITIEESQLEYVANELLTINTVSEAKVIMKFIDKMEELDDVQNVFSNFEIDDAIASELEE
jgi:YebC/PmpR family DNA-binding regulatory protein